MTLPTIRACLAASLDGKLSGGARMPDFTSRADRHRLFALRAQSDLILVGAETVRSENLAPLIRDPKLVQDRVANGLQPHPDVAIVSRSGALRWQSDYFSHPVTFLLVSPTHPPEMPSRIVYVPVDQELGAGMHRLFDLGYRNVLCEGGGRLIHAMLAENLIGELHVTLAPTVLGGETDLARGAWLNPRPQFTLSSVDQIGDELHLVYLSK
ncbi:MAG: dihydrofolate reductase family protein [Acidobacteria bacterium]|nr:dihydrofolate reductase family protein [Acidobacteriota bacterium]